jgi:hypothetical protein
VGLPKGVSLLTLMLLEVVIHVVFAVVAFAIDAQAETR